ncbi:probable copper-transporting ATPase HMA5 [Phalaenopsis equestris]|uniref:probable copper-transporting ATPase HMA5 n=1 Tax=Phalaenopsis equestris TaxID=78828 RepID=UPI0009E2111D|nr:probable copper-transporting ATPase HMA5 [Phalaenopsis equestris]
MASRGFLMSCLRAECSSRDLSAVSRYPSMPKYPKGAAKTKEAVVEGNGVEVPPERHRTAMFSVVGMACSACAGSVEKAIKRLTGIHNAAVDVLNNRAEVIFYPKFVSPEIHPPKQKITAFARREAKGKAEDATEDRTLAIGANRGGRGEVVVESVELRSSRREASERFELSRRTKSLSGER